MTSVSALVADLEGQLGSTILSRPLDLDLYARDASLLRTGHAAAVCLPRTTEDVRRCVEITRAHGRSFTPRGSGTGLVGGSVPDDGSVVISTANMTNIVEIDVDNRVAWVEPGVLNADLSSEVAHLGLRFAPDPSSQQLCSIGGNVATNAGGAHCLRYGVTSAHVMALEVVLADGVVTVVGGLDPEPPGYDLRGVLVGSEGTLGIVTKIAARLTPLPPSVGTALLAFDSTDAAAATVSAVIAAGIVPAALEMMDAPIVAAIEASVQAGYPTDAEAVLLIELDGPESIVDREMACVLEAARRHDVASVQVAIDDEQRALLWTGRKAAGRVLSQLAPDHYLHDTVVPRSRLVAALRRIRAIAHEVGVPIVNVFHAGDGNLHPIILYDRAETGSFERVKTAAEGIILACLAEGGVLSGEHGIGIEKRDYMALLYGPDDLDAQARLRDAFDPEGIANPGKVLPAGSRCFDSSQLPEGSWI